MKICTFATLKGGVGKSSALFNLAGILAENDKKTLVIDLDAQCNITNNLGVARAQNTNTIKEIFEDNMSPEDVIIHLENKIDIIPSSIFLTATELKMVARSGREYILKNWIDDNEKYLNKYDYILLDTNPSINIINQNAFVSSEHIILLSDISMNSYEGSELFIALWADIRKNLKLEDNISGFLINQYDKRISLSKDYLEFCKKSEVVKDILFNTVIPNNVKIKESEIENMPINIYDKKSAGCKAYQKLYLEMIERGIF